MLLVPMLFRQASQNHKWEAFHFKMHFKARGCIISRDGLMGSCRCHRRCERTPFPSATLNLGLETPDPGEYGGPLR